MGVFLQVALFPGSDGAAARVAVAQAARTAGISLNVDACQYTQNVAGTAVQLEGALGFADLAEELSRVCCAPVMLLYLYDSDFWGYDYYFAGREVDHFSSCPEYFGEDGAQCERLAGNPSVLVGDFPIRRPEEVNRYFPLSLNCKPEAEAFAYPGDRYPYGDCWQMTDFIARLGFLWAFDAEDLGGPSTRPPQPTLEQILDEEIPPRPAEAGALGERIYPLAGNLPTALSREYIREILRQSGYEKYAQMTPREITEQREEAKVGFGGRLPFMYVEPRLCMLSAFSAFWLGNPVTAFWELYEAVGKGTDNIALLRARGMAVPLFSKRHIAIKDVSQLMELNPANRDVYLLCRAFFCGMWGQQVEQARADLAALDRLGTLCQADPRLNFSAFDPVFLEAPEAFFLLEQERDRQRLSGMMEALGEGNRLREEKEARRLQLILEKRRKKKSEK